MSKILWFAAGIICFYGFFYIITHFERRRSTPTGILSIFAAFACVVKGVIEL